MIRHQDGQMAVPVAAFVTMANRFNNDGASYRITEMIGVAWIGADRDEEIGFRADPLGRRSAAELLHRRPACGGYQRH
jgi:hypothetical protein